MCVRVSVLLLFFLLSLYLVNFHHHGGGLVDKLYLTLAVPRLLCPWDFPGKNT